MKPSKFSVNFDMMVVLKFHEPEWNEMYVLLLIELIN